MALKIRGVAMELRQLGESDLWVSALSLGTMTFGEQNSEADAHAQLDLAVSRGGNFIDTADLYQIHWPDRYVPMFGATGYDVTQEHDMVPIIEQLEALAELIKAGKVRHIGLSNETPGGVCEFSRCADTLGLPKIVSVQNAYHLMNRTFESGLGG